MTTVLTDDRETAVRVGYFATDWRHPLSFDDYCAALKSWAVKAIIRDGECIGAVYTEGDEVHVSVLPEWRRRWATRGLLKQIVKDKAVTRVSPGHEYMYDILSRLGFKSSDDGSLVKGV